VQFKERSQICQPSLKEEEMRMAMRIRVTTRADLFEKRKQQHIERGYRIEDEQPIPVNGFCSLIAVGELASSDLIGELVAEALKGQQVLGESRGLGSLSAIHGGCIKYPGSKSLILRVHRPQLRTENREPQI
jgi:hypothetical protein